jgi:hypothetical protein
MPKLRPSEQKIFQTASGKNYRDTEILDQEQVKQFFEQQGYKVTNLKQPWRHLVGILEKDNQKYFLKMATGEGIAERTKNEAQFNHKVFDLITKNKIDFFTVPEIIKEGHYQKHYYFICLYYYPDPSATKEPPNPKNLKKWLSQIVEINHFLESLPNLDLPWDQSNPDRAKEYLRKNQLFYDETKDPTLKPILDLANSIKDYYKPALNHGDFVPWHLFQNGKQLILIDSEAGSNLKPKYYDVAYFYRAVYTTLGPELAKKYLALYLKTISAKEKQIFKPLFKSLLAIRILGGRYDTIVEKKQLSPFYHQIQKELLEGEII